MDMMEQIKEHKILVGGVPLLLLLGAVFLFWTGGGETEATLSSFPETPQITSSAVDLPEETSSSTEDGTEPEEIVIDVKGAVMAEGVYELPLGSRVTDAIKAAGGFTEEADKKSVNLAQKLSDEGLIYVATVGENISATANQTGGLASSLSGGKLNLNKATLAELTTLSGIGQKRAQDIIAYRDSKGGFSAVEELGNVSGIGDKTLERLKAEVTVD